MDFDALASKTSPQLGHSIQASLRDPVDFPVINSLQFGQVAVTFEPFRLCILSPSVEVFEDVFSCGLEVQAFRASPEPLPPQQFLLATGELGS